MAEGKTKDLLRADLHHDVNRHSCWLQPPRQKGIPVVNAPEQFSPTTSPQGDRGRYRRIDRIQRRRHYLAIDLDDKNATKFHNALQFYIDHATRVAAHRVAASA